MEAADNIAPVPDKESVTGTPPAANQHVRRNPPIAGEAEAIAKAQAGDAQAFETLYSLHKRRVYSLCLRMLGNVAEAEDLTQEAFLQLFRKIGTFRGDSAFSTWLHRLAVNVVLMHLRKKGLPQISLEEALEPSQEDGPRKDLGCPGFDSFRLLGPCYARASSREPSTRLPARLRPPRCGGL